MITKKVSESDGGFNAKALEYARKIHPNKWLEDDFLSKRLSGTLLKSARLGLHVNKMVMEEALAQVLGWEFKTIPASYVTTGMPLAEGDCPAITEFGWHLDRIQAFNMWGADKYQAAWISITNQEGEVETSGLAIILAETDIQWIPNGNLVYAMIAEYNPKTKSWGEAKNPF